MLNNAVADRGSSFRVPVFICVDQSGFDGKIVVLRKSDETNNLLQFHSDIRSDKIEKLKNNKITKESWSKTGHISRKYYLVDNGPGTESPGPTSGLKPELDNYEFTMKESEQGYKNFTVIQCKIKSIEWLYLAAKGHRRAKFELDNNKEYWLVL